MVLWSFLQGQSVCVAAIPARLNCKANLYQKHISPDSRCPRCNHHYENTDHIFLHCPLTRRIWQRLGILTPDYIEELWDIHDPVSTTRSIWPFILLLLLWKIWAARNAMTFRSIDQHSAITIRLMITELDLWSHRPCNNADKESAFSWRLFLSSRLRVPM
ncbi:Myosin-2 heavy chain [Hordeum vulgare]|nr:Myosin-2 heavy chain [Hordeum vulgare]